MSETYEELSRQLELVDAVVIEDAKYLFEAIDISKLSSGSLMSDGHFSGLNEEENDEGDGENGGEEEEEGEEMEVEVEVEVEGDNVVPNPIIPILYKWSDDPNESVHVVSLRRIDCLDYEDFKGVTDLVDELVIQSNNPNLQLQHWMSEFEAPVSDPNRVQGFFQLPLDFTEAVQTVRRVVVFYPEIYEPGRN